MSAPIEDYALLSDLHTGPLVSREGSIDWLCLPRFDSSAIFCALLGGVEDGRWKLSVADGTVAERRYLGDTFVLTTTWRSPTGVARVTDYLPPSQDRADLMRRVECLEGSVTVLHDLRIRLDYARARPWVRRVHGPAGPGMLSIAGPDALLLSGTETDWVLLDDASRTSEGDDARPHHYLEGRLDLQPGESANWDLTWFHSWDDLPRPADPEESLVEAIEYWEDFAQRLDCAGEFAGAVRRSLLVLRALTHRDTGGIVAAATTSLPEEFGGSRNWDYRYTWLRDAALTIEVLLAHGLTRGATEWRDWLLRAVAGDLTDLRIMYGLGGERELDEKELDHLEGYEGSRPVRIGNGAAAQYQADVPGEVMLALGALRRAGVEDDEYSWGLQRGLLRYCEEHLDRMDHGIWEMRGELHYFTHGRAMMWAAFDQGVRAVEEDGLDGDVVRWRELRDQLRAEIFDRGYHAELDSFTQTYGDTEVDASLLQLPHTGLIAADDPMMLGTVARIEADLVDEHGLVYRYRTEAGLDGLDGHEYPFLICPFWLVEQYAESGRLDEARTLMRQLVGYANDVGLLAEEYDPASGRLAGNYPQAFSHIGLVRAADAIRAAADAIHRPECP